MARRGTNVGQAYVAVTADGRGINEEIVDSVDEAEPGIRKAGKEHGKAYGDEFEDSLSVKFSHAGEKAGAELNRRMADAGDDGGKEYGDGFERSFKKMSKRLGKNIGEKIAKSMTETLEGSFARMIDLMEDRLANINVSRNRTPAEPKMPDLGDRVGGMLGAGSRNNFLNFFGRSLGNIVGLVDKVRTGATGMFKVFSDGWKSAGEGATLFQRLAGGSGAIGTRISAGFSSIASAAPAAAVAIIVVVAAMSAMVSVASALLALLTALTATIVSALTGAVLVLGGAFVAAAAAGGLLAAAFLSMTDAQQKMLSGAFKPLKAELVGLGQLMIRDMIPHFQTWADNLKEAIALAGPLASVMGKAFGKAGDSLTAALGGPGFKNLFNALKQDLPGITKNLSTALGSFLNGLGGVFAAIMPMVLRFSNYLAGVADRFSEWANSAAGQNAIVDFVNRAVASLKSLWGFAKEFVGFITDVLFSEDAQSAGNSMFDSLADSFEGFRKKVQQLIKDGTFKKWFDDAREFGGKLKDLIISLKNALVKLNNSGVLDAVGDGIESLSSFIEDCNAVLGPLVDYLGFVLPKMMKVAEVALENFTVVGILSKLGSILSVAQKVAAALASITGHGGESLDGAEQNTAPPATGSTGPRTRTAPGWALGGRARTTTEGAGGGGGGGRDWAQYLINLGNSALNGDKNGGGGGGVSGNGSGSGGEGGKGDKKKWHNPFIKFANSLIKDGPSIARQLGTAMTQMLKQVRRSLTDAAKAADLESAQSILSDQMVSLRDTGRAGVALAQDALNSAAERLAGASNKKEAARALKAVLRAQGDLDTAIKNQTRLNRAADLLEKQKKQTNAGPLGLIGDVASLTSIRALAAVQNKTLADFAASRSKAAVLIQSANQQLTEALALRDDYKKQIADSIRSFGELTSIQGQVIDGVTAAVTATDIVTGLQDRLAQIKSFQSNLQVLLAQGLSQEAYKQILDAGVEGGSAYAQALVDGGSGAVGAVNSLTSQIGGVADALGLEASNRLYQAGVDAAQGLVDGLTALSGELDAAATALGERIALAIEKALTGKGGGGKGGGGGSGGKVIASNSLSKQVAVSPEVAQYAARKGQSVSGNGERPIDLTIVTPTKDPYAVAQEALNELTGRL